MQFTAAPISAGYAAAAYEDLAVIGEFEFASGQDFADRAAAGLKRMIQADQRRGFRQPVSLDHGISQSMPEFFGIAIEGRAAADHGPKLPSKLAANVAERPPAPQKVLALSRCVAPCELLAPSAVFEIAFDLLLQRLDHPWNRYQY